MTRRDLYDAIMVGAVERVRPKMMTVVAITLAVIETPSLLRDRSSMWPALIRIKPPTNVPVQLSVRSTYHGHQFRYL